MELAVVLWLTAVAVALAALYMVVSNKLSSRTLRLPPSPPGLPLVGNLGVLVSSPFLHVSLSKLSLKYGPIFMLRLGSKPAVVITSPPLAKEVLKTQDHIFASRPESTIKDHLFYGEDCIAMNSGPRLTQMRKVLATLFLNTTRIDEFGRLRMDEFSSMIQSILNSSQKDHHGDGRTESGGGIDLHQQLFFASVNTITRLLISKRLYVHGTEISNGRPGGFRSAAEAQEFQDTLDSHFFLAGAPIVGDWIPQLAFLDKIKDYRGAMRKTHARMDQFSSDLIAERRANDRKTSPVTAQSDSDLLDALLSDKEFETLTDDQIKSVLVETLLSSTHTQVTFMEWAMAELIRHPDSMAKLQRELDSVVGTSRTVAESDLPNLPYLRNVLKETSRLHPPVVLLIPHRATQQCKLGGYDIPKDTAVFVNVWAIGRLEHIWKDPQNFYPDRFEGTDVDLAGKHFELLPFGSGRRGCPGLQLGSASVMLAIALLVHTFNWSLPNGAQPADLDMSENFGITVAMAQHLVAVPSPRLACHPSTL